MLAVLKNVPDKIKVLVFLVLMGEFVPVRWAGSFCIGHCRYRWIHIIPSGSLLEECIDSWRTTSRLEYSRRVCSIT